MGEEIAFENGRISNFQGLVTLILNRVIVHTVMHHSSTSSYIPNFIKSKKLFVDGWTDGHLRPTLLGRLAGVDLINSSIHLKIASDSKPWSLTQHRSNSYIQHLQRNSIRDRCRIVYNPYAPPVQDNQCHYISTSLYTDSILELWHGGTVGTALDQQTRVRKVKSQLFCCHTVT